jgi:hypothetical protein
MLKTAHINRAKVHALGSTVYMASLTKPHATTHNSAHCCAVLCCAGRYFDVNEAEEKLTATLKWRHTFK